MGRTCIKGKTDYPQQVDPKHTQCFDVVNVLPQVLVQLVFFLSTVFVTRGIRHEVRNAF